MKINLKLYILPIFALLLCTQHLYKFLINNHNRSTATYTENNLLLDIYDCSYNSDGDSISLSELKRRAFLMGNIEWVPIYDIPNNIGHFKKDKKVIGLPYSSVKELQKFIGLDVSIYTFLTAISNPYSLLYTEDVSAGNQCYLGGIYNGKNSHSFYGTVCSSFTAFCYGENNNYTSFNYRNGNIPNYYLKQDQSINGISIGDLLWSPGHIALITEVEKDSIEGVKRIEVYESSGATVHHQNYTPKSFYIRKSGKGIKEKQGYIYSNRLVEKSAMVKDESLTIQQLSMLLNNLPIHDNEICTWFGDKPCIGEWDKIMINFKKKDYNKLLISLNDKVIDTLNISGIEHKIEYNFNRPGIYKAQLASDSLISSNFTYFEVIDTTTKFHKMENGSVEIFFANNSDPEIVYWVNKSGEQQTYPITVSRKAKSEGKMTIKPCSKKDASVRVIYRGKYGRAINKPEHLFTNH